jgi:hypothetical protein
MLKKDIQIESILTKIDSPKSQEKPLHVFLDFLDSPLTNNCIRIFPALKD